MKKVILPGGFSYYLPETIEEAKNLAENARIKDPYQEIIKPSLLNKHDIVKYVSKTGMIFPFYTEKLKSASYEVPVGNEFVRWTKDKDGKIYKEHKKNLSTNVCIPLERNSITFVDVDATFYIPYYIALRFNLSITHVHRGILLGTGPLIDPGFCGKIMIPIHNLTNNDYYLRPGKTLIAVEFTKLTPDEILMTKKDDISAWYKENIKKEGLTFSDFFGMALPHGISSVESSIGRYIDEAEKSVKHVEKKSEAGVNAVKRSANIVSGAAFIALLALLFGLIAAYIQIQGVVAEVNKYVSDATHQYNSTIKELSSKIDKLSVQIENASQANPEGTIIIQENLTTEDIEKIDKGPQ